MRICVLIIILILNNAWARVPRFDEIEFPPPRPEYTVEYARHLSAKESSVEHLGIVRGKEDRINEIQDELAGDATKSFARKLLLIRTLSPEQRERLVRASGENERLVVDQIYASMPQREQDRLKREVDYEISQTEQYKTMMSLKGELESYIEQNNLRESITEYYKLNNKAVIYSRDQFADEGGRDLLKNNPLLLRRTSDCEQIQNSEEKNACFRNISGDLQSSLVKNKYKITSSEQSIRFLKDFLSIGNNELGAAKYANSFIKNIEDKLKCLKDMPSRFARCHGELNEYLYGQGFRDLEIPPGSDAIAEAEALIRKLKTVRDYLSTGVFSQFVSLSCQKDELRKRFPGLKVGEVVPTGDSSLPSVGSVLSSYQVAFGKSFNDETSCPRENFILPFKSDEEAEVAHSLEIGPNFDFVYDDVNELLGDISYDENALENIEDDSAVRERMLSSLLNCSKSEDQGACEEQFENRDYPICDNKSYNTSNPGPCKDCSSKVAGLPCRTISALTGGYSTVFASIENLEDPNNVSTEHYKYLMRAIGVSERVKQFCSTFGISVRAKDFPASCSDKIYDQFKHNITSCGEGVRDKEILLPELQSVAQSLKGEIEDLNQQEELFSRVSDVIENRLREPESCKRFYSAFSDSASVEMVHDAPFNIAACMVVSTLKLPSVIKNASGGLKNDYLRYLRTGDERFLDKYVNGMGVFVSGNWSARDKEKLRRRIKERVNKEYTKAGEEAGRDLLKMRDDIYQQKRKIQSLLQSNPYLITDLLGEKRAESTVEDGDTLFPKIDELKLLSEFANEGGNLNQLLDRSKNNARGAIKGVLDNICSANLDSLVSEKEINSKTLRLFPNLKEMDECIKGKIRDRESIYDTALATGLVFTGLGVCALSGTTVCIGTNIALGAGVTAYDLQTSKQELADKTQCNLTTGGNSESCNTAVLEALKSEVDMNRALFWGMEIPMAIADVVPVGKVLRITADMAMNPRAAARGIKSSRRLREPLRNLKRMASKLLEANKKIINTQVKHALKSISDLPYSLRTKLNNRLTDILSSMDGLVDPFMLSKRAEFPDVEFPDSYLYDLANLSSSKRAELLERMNSANSADELQNALQEMADIRTVQNKLDSELGVARARKKYPCMY